MAIRFRLFFMLLITSLLFSGCSASSDASEIDDMANSLEAAVKRELDKGNIAKADYFVSMMDGLKLEKKLILASPEERLQKDLDALNKLMTQFQYEKVLKENLPASQYQQLQQLRKKYKYIKD